MRITLAALVLVPALAVLAVVVLFDADSAKPRIIAAVEAATGRELVIAGPIRLVPSLHPAIELTEVSLSNPPGFSRPRMAVLKRVDVRVALLPLLSRRIAVDSLILHGADILLEMNAQGMGNWRFTPPAAEPRPAGPQGAKPRMAEPTKAPTPAIHIAKIEIDDGQIAYRNARMAAPVVLAIRTLTLTTGAPDEPIRLSMAASADTTPLSLSGRVGSADAFFGSPLPPLNFDLVLASSGATLSLAGTIADAFHLSGTDIRLSADIPDLAALSGLAHTGLPPLRAITVRTRLTDLATHPGLLTGFTLHDLKLALPQAQLDGEVSLTRGSPPLLQGRLHAARIDADALRAAKVAPAPEASPPPPARSTPPPARLIPDQDLPLDALRDIDADLTLAIGELVLGGVTYRDLAGHAALKDAALRVDPFTATVPGGKIRLMLAVDAARPVPPVTLTLSAPALDIAPWLAAFKLPPYAQGNLRFDADIHGAGRSPHQIAATLNGSIGLSMENAQIDGRALGEALNGLGMLQNGKSGFTALRCLAARLDARDGAGTLRALLLDTAPVRLSGTGGLNLGEETLAIRLQTMIRLGATGIGAPLDLGGTFLAPRLKIDAAMPGSGARANTKFGLVIGKLGLDQLVPGAAGQSCASELAIARGETPPERIAEPPRPADLLRQLLR